MAQDDARVDRRAWKAVGHSVWQQEVAAEQVRYQQQLLRQTQEEERRRWERHAQEVAAAHALQQQLADAEKKLRVRQRVLEQLLAMSPTEFERMVGQMLATHGYRNMRHTGGPGDLAADLTCTAPDGRQVVVQCKRWAPTRRVGSPEIQKFIGMVTVHHRAHLGLFVTTAQYSKAALSLAAQHSSYLKLYSGETVIDMMLLRRGPR